MVSGDTDVPEWPILAYEFGNTKIIEEPCYVCTRNWKIATELVCMVVTSICRDSLQTKEGNNFIISQ